MGGLSGWPESWREGDAPPLKERVVKNAFIGGCFLRFFFGIEDSTHNIKGLSQDDNPEVAAWSWELESWLPGKKPTEGWHVLEADLETAKTWISGPRDQTAFDSIQPRLKHIDSISFKEPPYCKDLFRLASLAIAEHIKITLHLKHRPTFIPTYGRYVDEDNKNSLTLNDCPESKIESYQQNISGKNIEELLLSAARAYLEEKNKSKASRDVTKALGLHGIKSPSDLLLLLEHEMYCFAYETTSEHDVRQESLSFLMNKYEIPSYDAIYQRIARAQKKHGHTGMLPPRWPDVSK
ncbi:hypothetical protein [Oceanidesulfovibrio marinus]|uniref:Uncharacterized protein n=1 Tax=Oceanidesulfovibrio marinus TaxID=370038 RepID=A0ABX6NGJ9_9BACT|nr:hypothetical protein [Oceanidesulfovibrio marinus]QJT09411.1 hypothetical protein E8L03_10870 [Oceanidesulfovibrio marinus]